MKINNKLLNIILFFSWAFCQELTPEINQLIQSSGLNPNDVKSLLKSQNLDKLIQENSKEEIGQNQPPESAAIVNELIGSEVSVNDKENLVEDAEENNNNETENFEDKSLNNSIKGISEKRINVLSSYFGYSTFFNDPEIFQKSSDFSIPPSYIIGPGDEIILMLWGDTEDVSDYVVSRDGYIFIPNIGRVFVNGLNLEGL